MMQEDDARCPAYEDCEFRRANGRCKCPWDAWMSHHQDSWPLVAEAMSRLSQAAQSTDYVLPAVVKAVRDFKVLNDKLPSNNSCDGLDIDSLWMDYVRSHVRWARGSEERRKRAHPYIGLGDVESQDMRESTVLESMDSLDDLELAHELLQALEPDDKMLLIMRFWGGMTYQEIADSMGVVKSYARRIVLRAMRAAQKALEELS